MKKKIDELLKELTRLEHTLDFTCFYSFDEVVESNYRKLPAFEFEGGYYELQTNNAGEVRLLEFVNYSPEGCELSSSVVEEITDSLKKIEAIKDIPVYISARKRLGKFEDSVAIWFKLDYEDVELYSLTVEDAYRTPYSKIVSKVELDSFLIDF